MKKVVFAAVLLFWNCTSGPQRDTVGDTAARRIPIILDTDIGTDIDDTWALALLLNMPQLDIRLIVTDSGDTLSRARVLAQFLERAGRTDIPVGIGTFQQESPVPQKEWAGSYQLERYPGKLYEDGVDALCKTILASDEPVTLIVLGPTPNIAEALKREPGIAKKARVVAMSGSVDVGYDNKPTPDPEYNVKVDAAASRAMYQAGWDVLIAPLDTAGTIRLDGELYQRVVASQKPEVVALMENYRIWAKSIDWTQANPDTASSILFDTLAVAMVESTQWVDVEQVRIEVTDDGFTRRSETGATIGAALRWKDRDAYQKWLVDKITGAR